MGPERRRRGRRPVSSRATLLDAAEELFLENGYAATTIEQITRRAGVSRNTFFNYFTAKSDLLFAGIDDPIADAARRLDQAAGSRTRPGTALAGTGSVGTAPAGTGPVGTGPVDTVSADAGPVDTGPAATDPFDTVAEALLAAAAGVEALRLPLAATQWDAMGVSAEIQAAGMARFTRLAEALRRFLTARAAQAGRPVPPDTALRARAAAYALAGACAAAGMHWLAAGVTRGPLPAVVAAAIRPVCDGFRAGPAARDDLDSRYYGGHQR